MLQKVPLHVLNAMAPARLQSGFFCRNLLLRDHSILWHMACLQDATRLRLSLARPHPCRIVYV
jgi:hypothetical protein